MSTVIPNAILELSVSTPTGQVVHNVSTSLGQLVSGANVKGNEVYEYQNTTSGIYNIQGQLKDAQGLVFATATTQYEVIENPLKALHGKVSVQYKQLYIGEKSQLCTSTLTNTGTQAFSDLSVKQILVRVSTKETISTQVSSENVLPGNSQTLVQSIDTNVLEPDHYNCLLVASINGKEETLAFDAFTLVTPPIVIDSQFELGNRGRILVLLDHEKDEYEEGHNHSYDPHGPQDAPSLTEQRAFLEAQLTAQRWSYTIVTDDDDFERELHSGGYNAYALFSEHEKLDETTQKELREAVFRGDGLLVAGSHDERNHNINDALGIKVIGKLSKVTELQLLASPISSEATQALAYTDKVLRVELLTAQSAALFNSKNTNNAVTYNQYGLGKAIFVGFDILAHATSVGENGLFDEVINQSLTYTQPTSIAPYGGRVVPLSFKLTNQGIATSGQVIMTLPVGSSVMDMKTSGSAASVTTEVPSNESVITWPYTIAEEQVVHLQIWLKLPNEVGNQNISALIQTGEAPDWKDYEKTTLTVQAQSYPVLSDINNNLLLLGNEKILKKARRYIEEAMTKLSQPDFDGAHEKLIHATDELINVEVLNVTGLDVATQRQQIDWVIADIARFIVHENDNNSGVVK